MKLKWVDINTDRYVAWGTVKYTIDRTFVGTDFLYRCGLEGGKLVKSFKDAVIMCQKYEDELNS